MFDISRGCSNKEMGGAVTFHIPHYAVKNLLGDKNKYQELSIIGPNVTPVPV